MPCTSYEFGRKEPHVAAEFVFTPSGSLEGVKPIHLTDLPLLQCIIFFLNKLHFAAIWFGLFSKHEGNEEWTKALIPHKKRMILANATIRSGIFGASLLEMTTENTQKDVQFRNAAAC